MSAESIGTKYVIVGGGVAGVSCLQELEALCEPGDSITLISASPVLKVASNVVKLTKTLEQFGSSASNVLGIYSSCE